MSPNNKKITKNRREQTIGFVYVSLLFAVTTVISCISLFYYNSDEKTNARKEFAISKMERIRSFQSRQSDEVLIIDSIYAKIKDFNPGINASYEENDIKYYLNDLKSIYEKNSHDGRYKIFYQVSSFYSMWFDDKKELWSKRQNIINFRRNLEQCELGLEKKKDELKSTRK